MFADIRKNKMKSSLIVSLFIVFVTLIIYYVLQAFELGTVAIIYALLFSFISAFCSYFFSDKIILSMSNARPATHEENQRLVNIFEAILIPSGLKYKPTLYVVDDPAPNAFATGRNPEHAIVCVTTGLLEKLDYYELEGVIAHELSHIKNYDILLSAIITVMVGLVVILSNIFTRRFLFSGKKSRDNDKNSGSIMMIIGLFCLVLAPIFSSLMQLAISRKREYLADATAIEFTRNPDGLISALQKLDSDTNNVQAVTSSTAHLYISKPIKKSEKKLSGLFSTHPPIEDRVNALRNIK